MRRVVAFALGAALVAGCSGDDAAPDGVRANDGWSVEVVRDDLEGPTQVVADPAADGTVWVAELVGGEDAAEGRVRRLDLDVAPGADSDMEAPRLAGLLTPTGVALLPAADGVLLAAQEQRVVTVVPLDGEDQPTADPREVGGRPPFNGRSQGTLTAIGDGRVLRVVTGTGSGPDPGDSGRLTVLDLVTGEEHVVAVGFKNAYAHAVGPDGALYVTEIGDGSYDGEVPRDELNVIPAEVWRAAAEGTGEPFDGGWPRCTGRSEPTEAFGATTEACEALPRPLATFLPRATPTSVAVTDDGRVLVALWVEGRVVEVDRVGDEDVAVVRTVAEGLDGPQHLLALPDGSVLLTVHGSGHLLRLTPP